MYSGESSVYFSAGLDAVGPVKSERLRPLLVTSPKRSSRFPEVPALSDFNLQEPQIDSWYGVFGPANMAAPLVTEINKSIQTVLADPDFRQKMDGAEVSPGTAADFARLVQSDFLRLARFAKQLNFKPE